MRSYMPPIDMLLTTAKKKPHLQALVDRALTMTHTEIDALQEKNWVKKALKQLQVRGAPLKQIEAINANTKWGVVEADTTEYEVRRYNGSAIWLKNGKTDIQLEPGKSFLVLATGQLQLDNLICSYQYWGELIRDSISDGIMDVAAYRRYYTNRVRGLTATGPSTELAPEPKVGWGTNAAGIKEFKWRA